ncbi:bifunctional aspartokinase / homoserine dehydrogenase 1 [Fistulifera solaris]|uniref:Bifunctional aspartokinase / homoserine dehydrogenase 1 n=1 Tax=Fistulifera solaris TaxID=1519565 RepID=A0A1Z5J616_FISSO|nr:bifunctional aspartokinase / homoserine dehydrogenase 1 [Fistulifera solaris]|eukprot:GAX09231.1 bifunctional aspartokinase / homoserine dehydrogenase 1 [Fistulifera solaris]
MSSSSRLVSIEEASQQSYVGFDGLKWQVHKFGGTSVANAECFLRAARIVEDQLGIADSTGDVSLSSSLGNTNCHLAVVVSAMGGKPKVTDLLLDSVKYAAKRDLASQEECTTLVLRKHDECLGILFQHEPETREKLLGIVQQDLANVSDILKTVSLMKWEAERIRELVSGFGEVWSAQILAALLQKRSNQRANKVKVVSLDALQDLVSDVHHDFVFLDARRVITIDEDEAVQDGAVVWDESFKKLESVFQQAKEELQAKHGSSDETEKMLHFIVTGYVASNTHGVACTLKRDGSDYSAAIMGRLLQANSIQIWTDVDGVLSADPRRVPLAQVLDEVSYNEAMELAFFGAKVIHPKTMQPALMSEPQIPIYIRNTFNASFRGTRIFTRSTSLQNKEKAVCGFTSIENMALINVEGSGMIGVRGILRRIFSSLEAINVNVILISQASSEHSVTFALVESDAKAAKIAIEEEFSTELRNNRITNIDLKAPCSVIAAVGDGMSQQTGVSGRFFSALGDAKINVLAIAQGSSERNISAVVSAEDSARALRAVHAAFRLSHTTIRVAIIGMNELGDSLLKLLQERRTALRYTYEVDLQIVAVLDQGSSSEIVCLEQDVDGGAGSITLESFNNVTCGSEVTHKGDKAIPKPGGISTLLERLFRNECTNHVVFDCTNDEEVGKYHATWLRAGVDVVTANNTGLSGPKEQRNEISKAEKAFGKQSANYLREVTVGGGLPIINTTRTLLHTGDKIRRVDGIFSVSLSYIMFRVSPPADTSRCSEFDQQTIKGHADGNHGISPSTDFQSECSFSQAVKEAIDLGLMEEDPTKDLNNEYTARVLMILSRELGIHHLETDDILGASEKLLGDTSDFLNLTQEIDANVKKRVDEARAKGCVIRQISSVDIATSEVEIRFVEVPDHHIFAVTPPSCECVRFFTHRHMTYPLVVQGPSAGADSTASALLADLLHHSRAKTNARAVSLSKSGTSAALTHMTPL